MLGTAHILLCATPIGTSVSQSHLSCKTPQKGILYSLVILPHVWQAFITYLLDEIVEVSVLHSYIPEVPNILQTSNFHVSILLILTIV